jgi:hypothetical protein
MKKLIYLYLLIGAACCSANPAIVDSDLVELSSSQNGSIKIKFSTLAQSKNNGGFLITSAIIQTDLKETSNVFFTDRYVINSDCERGYGQLHALDLEGKFIFKSAYVLGGDSNASIIADALCSFYRSNQKRTEKKQLLAPKSESEAKWRNTINEFIATEKIRLGGLDYQGNSELMSALDSYVRDLAKDVANEDKTMLWFLTEADRLVKIKFSINKQ